MSTMTMTLPPTTTTLLTSTPEEPCCPNCGLSLPAPSSEPHAALLQAQRQIEDLQSQVRLLNQKATAAVDRWADYEDELSRLRAASTSTNATNTTPAKNKNNNNSNSINNTVNRPHTPDPSVSTNASSPRSSFLGAGASRISQLLSPRKSAAAAASSSSSTSTSTSTSANPHTSSTSAALHLIQRGSLSSPALLLGPRDPGGVETTNIAETRELLAALTHERRLRAAAEEKLAATSREVEDLSASLFEQANAMVATERRARAALEDRVAELGLRDREKKVRLGRLEGAVLRIERAREVLRRDEGEDEEGGREKEKEKENGRGRGEGEGKGEELGGEEEEEEEEEGAGRPRDKEIGAGNAKEEG
ncbi:hypothetical protein F4859DRAFT_11640 [Xylaria cf. heliscus]|nr:hypothetical protein F4859DRAFT_11640 [Xylaria cf. heliscus]